MKYQAFVFESYAFNVETRTLELSYSFDETLHFTETYTFNFAFESYDPAVLDKALQLLFFMAGVSYYKAYLPPSIIVKAGQIDTQTSQFLEKTWQHGLGEFFYVNQIDPRTAIHFPVTTAGAPTALQHRGTGALIGLGGGKDSLVSVELLRNATSNLATWSLGHETQLQPLVEAVGVPHFSVQRQWDKKLLELNKTEAYNGHVPISALFACVGAVVAILSGKRDVVVSNEQSANEPTLTYRGIAINHQYSKSQEFERDIQQLLATTYGGTIRYYSLLRPLSELRIAELFAKIGFEKYKTTFSSCNRAYTANSTAMSWCAECPKCAFVYMILTPFVDKRELAALWGGKNLLQDPALQPLYESLVGIAGDKPLECIGEIQESRTAMQLCFATYPELQSIYQFELPDDYDYKRYMSNELPSEVDSVLRESINKL